jgi:hypothetical protein
MQSGSKAGPSNSSFTATDIPVPPQRPEVLSAPRPETLRLYASILRKPMRSAASCSGRPPLSDRSLQTPGEILLAAANALEFQAGAIEARLNEQTTTPSSK